MRIASFNKDIPLQFDEKSKTLLKNVKYIMADNILHEIISVHRRLVVDIDEDFYFKNEKRRYKGEDLNNKSIITIRNGGIGDAMFQIPGLKELKNKYSNSKIAVAYNTHFNFIYEGLEFIDEINDLPLEYDIFDKYDYFVAYEGEMEGFRAETENAYDIHNSCLFVTPQENIPEIIVDKSKESEIQKYYKFNKNDKIVVIQYKASNHIRSVDYNLWANLILNSPSNLHYIFVGSKSQYSEIDAVIRQTLSIAKKNNKNIKIDSFEHFTKKPYGLKYAITLIDMSSLVIGGDSGLLHIAGALQRPLIGLYGAFPSRLRLSTYKNAIGINSNSSCIYARGEYKSCFQNSADSCKLSVKYGENFSPCMAVHSPQIILQQFSKLKVI